MSSDKRGIYLKKSETHQQVRTMLGKKYKYNIKIRALKSKTN